MTKLQLPFKVKARITQTFGNVLYINGKNVYAQWGLNGHNGIDYGLLNDTPIYAPHDGKIKELSYDKFGYGWYIKIQSDKEGSVLAHNRKFLIKVGDYVKKGQLVGYSDNSGFSTGSHLHWGYYRLPRDRSNGYNGYIDQSRYLESTMPQENTIEKFLISKGYTYTKTHLEVIQALYQSDLKLKSGKYILKENCNKEKENLKEKCKKEKENLEKKHQDAVIKLKSDFIIKKKKTIENALKKAKKDWKVVKLEDQVTEYEKIASTVAYKVAKTVGEILEALNIIKKNRRSK